MSPPVETLGLSLEQAIHLRFNVSEPVRSSIVLPLRRVSAGSIGGAKEGGVGGEHNWL